jgi:hypothetical protein
MPRRVAAFVFLAALVPGAALADDLIPPKPGLSVKFRFANGLEQTMTVVAVDGLESRGEFTRSDQPFGKSFVHSYRVWYTRRVETENGALVQESPTAKIDEFATLSPGKVLSFPAKLRYEAAADRPTLPNGQPNRSWDAEVTMSYEVERKETVTVPAGTFETFVLKRTQLFADAAGKPFRREYTRIWFAPELRWWVKIESKSELPEGAATISEAVEIKRP